MDALDYARRSFVRRRMSGAVFAEIEDAGVALHFGRPEDEATGARALGLADLSPCPRYGFKGSGALDWLRLQGVRGLAADNRASVQDDGARALRLSPGEALLLPGLEGASAHLAGIAAAWSLDRAPHCYAVPRADSHYWFALVGARVPEMMAKLSAVDFRPAKFEDGRIAQTSVARSSAIVARRDLGSVPAYDLLGDSASADYMWVCLEDAMAELGGVRVGLDALARLARP